MTYLERLKQNHSDWTDDQIRNFVEKQCPESDHIMDVPEWCDALVTCEKCWSREIPGTEGKTLADAFVQAGASAVKTGNAIQKLAEAVEDLPPVIKDSGERRQFYDADGNPMAVRDIQEGKGRCDLMPLDVVAGVYECGEQWHKDIFLLTHKFQSTGETGYLYQVLHCFGSRVFADPQVLLLEVAKHFEDGAKKYGENNWQKGIPVRCYIDSAVRHYLKWLRGDNDEPHDRAFCWNIICAIWTCKHKPELNDYAVKEEN